MRTAIASLFLVVMTTAASGQSKSLAEIQKIVDNGGFQHYSGLKTLTRTPVYPWVLGAKLENGTVAPKIINPRKLLEEARKKQVVKVSGPADFCYPIYEELAHQNGVSCEYLTDHLELHWEEEEFNPAFDVEELVEIIIPEIEEAMAEVTVELNDDDTPAPTKSYNEQLVDELNVPDTTIKTKGATYINVDGKITIVYEENNINRPEISR